MILLKYVYNIRSTA